MQVECYVVKLEFELPIPVTSVNSVDRAIQEAVKQLKNRLELENERWNDVFKVFIKRERLHNVRC